jgi:hypothetical protein
VRNDAKPGRPAPKDRRQRRSALKTFRRMSPPAPVVARPAPLIEWTWSARGNAFRLERRGSSRSCSTWTGTTTKSRRNSGSMRAAFLRLSTLHSPNCARASGIVIAEGPHKRPSAFLGQPALSRAYRGVFCFPLGPCAASSARAGIRPRNLWCRSPCPQPPCGFTTRTVAS